MRSLRDATRCLGLRGQCIAALSGRVIGPTHRGCQRPSSRNCRIARKFFGTPRSPYVSGLGRTWATFLRRSDYNVCIESSAPVGLPAFQLPGTGGLEEPVAFPMRPGNFERSARHWRSRLWPVFFLALIPEFPCVRQRHAPESFP